MAHMLTIANPLNAKAAIMAHKATMAIRHGLTAWIIGV